MIWQHAQPESRPTEPAAHRRRAMRLRARLRRQQLEAALAGQLDRSRRCAARARRVEKLCA